MERLVGFSPDDSWDDKIAGLLQSPALLASLGLMTDGVPGFVGGMQQGAQATNNEWLRRKLQEAQQQQQAPMPQAPMAQAQSPVAPQYTSPGTPAGAPPIRPELQGGSNPSLGVNPSQTPSTNSTGFGAGTSNPGMMRSTATALMVYGNSQERIAGASMLNQLDQQARADSARRVGVEDKRQQWLLSQMLKDRRLREQRQHELDKLDVSQDAQNARMQQSIGAQNRRTSFVESGRARRHSSRMSMQQEKLRVQQEKDRAEKLSELRQGVDSVDGIMNMLATAKSNVDSRGTAGYMGMLESNLPLGFGQSQRELDKISNEGVLALVSRIPGHLSNKELDFLGRSVPHYSDYQADWDSYILRGYQGVYSSLLKAAESAERLGDEQLAAHYRQKALQARARAKVLQQAGARGQFQEAPVGVVGGTQ